MKRIFALLLALTLVLTGCSEKVKTKDISVKDVCCPYEINHKKADVEITLRDETSSGISWQVAAMPEDICQVMQEDNAKNDVYQYRVTGNAPGVAQLTFSALREDSTVLFTLTVVVEVNAKGKVYVSSSQHWERNEMSVEADGMRYQWHVDESSILHFTFLDEENRWSIRGDGEGVCTLSNQLLTPSGSSFSAQALAEGKTSVLLVSKTLQRQIAVTIQADHEGNLEVISVQEQ